MILFSGLKRLGLLFVAVLLLSEGCKRPEDGPGLGLLPAGDGLGANQTDTITVTALTRYEDSLKTSTLSTQLVGSYQDPVFGMTRAGIATQVRLSTSEVNFPTNYEVDSVILSMVYDGDFYGRLRPQRFNVYELSEDLYLDSSYYTNQIPSHNYINLWPGGGDPLEILPETPAVVDGDTTVPQLRIPLNLALADQLFGLSVEDDDAFRQAFKGLAVFAESGDGGVFSVDLVDEASKLTIYYRENPGTPEADTTFYDFLITSDCAKYTFVEHNYLSTPFQSIPEEGLDGSFYTYVQSTGLRTRIDFPFIDELNAIDGRTINGAELLIPYEPDERYDEPGQLLLVYEDSEGNLRLLPDQLAGSLGGLADRGDRLYRFNISRYLQAFLSGDIDSQGLFLLSGNAATGLNRVVLHGPAYDLSDRRNSMRLVVTYSY